MRLSDDRGASAILIAASMILLCGFVALAVDIGAGTDERRQDQTAADSGSLGGSLELVITNQANPMQAAVNEIYALVDSNLRPVPWDPYWKNCTDPGALTYPVKSTAFFNVTNGSDCISLSADFNTVRVRVPPQQVATTFGAMLNTAALPVSAFAESRRNTDFGGNSGAFPSGVFNNTPPGTELCVKTGPAGQESCGASVTGDFANFRPYFYAKVNNDPAAICTSGEQGVPIARSMADGIDHYFSVSSTYPPATPYINGIWCQTAGIPGPPFPNQVDSTAGYNSGDITKGLVTGDIWYGSFTGRLERSFAYTTPGMSVTIFDHYIDNRPLWDFLIDSDLSLPQVCQDAAAHVPHPTTPGEIVTAISQLQTCLSDPATSNRVLFIPEVGISSRLAAAPLYWELTWCGNNACRYTIKEFVPIFIHGLWARNDHNSFDCTGTLDPTDGTMCVHKPGMTGLMNVSPPGLKKVDSASALLLKCEQLPAAVCDRIRNAGGPRVLKYDLQLTR